MRARLIEQVPVQSPIQIHTDTARYYPYGVAAAHTLTAKREPRPDTIPNDGIKTYTFKTKIGKTGLEFSMNFFREIGTEIWRVDPLGFKTVCSIGRPHRERI